MLISNAGKRDQVFFGIDAAATKCVDRSLGEFESPPFPPSGILYSAFNELPCLGIGLRSDIHPVNPLDTFKLRLQLYDENASLATVAWSSTAMRKYADSAKMSGGGFSVNMLTDSLFSWNPSELPIGSFRMYISWKEGADRFPVPVIRSVAPNGGTAGTLLRITGFNFGSLPSAGIVTISSVSIPVIDWSDTLITAIIPPGCEGNPELHVTVSGVASKWDTNLSIFRAGVYPLGTQISLVNGGRADTAFFGMHPLATQCIDPELGEVEMPSLSPDPDTRCFFNERACLGAGLKLDLRPALYSDMLADTLRLGVILADTLDTLAMLKWSPSKLSWAVREASLYCGRHSADMLNDSVLRWDPRKEKITRAYLTIVWRSLIDTLLYPDIITISPGGGPVGSTLTIRGLFFGEQMGNGFVSIGGVDAQVLHWEDQKIIVRVPTGIAGRVRVKLYARSIYTSFDYFHVTEPNTPAAGLQLVLSNGGLQDTSYFGFASWATYCIDEALGERAIGIFPPAGTLFSAFDEFDCLAEGLKSDIHYGSTRGDRFRLRYQLADTVSSTAGISWLPEDMALYADSAFVTCGSETANMITTSSLSWNPAIETGNHLNLQIYWKPSRTILPTPIITSMDPTNGQIGALVKLVGKHFGETQNGSLVYLDWVQALPSFWSDTMIIVSVPGSHGTNSMRVYVSGAYEGVHSPVQFTTTTPPYLGAEISLSLHNEGVTSTGFFGIHRYATECTDGELGETESPPFPPSGLQLYTFAEKPCLGNGLPYDLHPGSSAVSTPDTFTAHIQPANENSVTASLAWSASVVAKHANSARMTGGGQTVDMMRDTVFTWNPSQIGLRSVRIFIDWKALPDSEQVFTGPPGTAGIHLSIANSIATDTAFCGAHMAATSCIDAALGESETPAFPDGALCMAFIESACLGNGLKSDLHPWSNLRDVPDAFTLRFQLADPNAPASIHWYPSKVSKVAGQAYLSINNTLMDMRSDSVFTWNPSEVKLSNARILVSWYSRMIMGTEKERILPVEYALNQNYPNPFNPVTIISYALPQEAVVHLTVYNVLGQVVRTLAEGIQQAGEKTAIFDGAGLPSGIYFYVLTATGTSDSAKQFIQTRKMLLVK